MVSILKIPDTEMLLFVMDLVFKVWLATRHEYRAYLKWLMVRLPFALCRLARLTVRVMDRNPLTSGRVLFSSPTNRLPILTLTMLLLLLLLLLSILLLLLLLLLSMLLSMPLLLLLLLRLFLLLLLLFRLLRSHLVLRCPQSP